MSARSFRAWLLAIHFALATVVGEAWHLVPGNDHGAGLVVGPGDDRPTSDGSLGGGVPCACASASLPKATPLLTADSCPICQFLSKARVASAAISVPMILSLRGTVPRMDHRIAWTPVVQSRGIRGPPA